MRGLVLALCISALLFSVSAQEKCGFIHGLEHLESQFPDAKSQIEEAHKVALAHSQLKTKAEEADTVYTLQVVFHIVYNSSAENLNEDLITSQMEILNETYRRKNADTVNTRAIFQPVAGDVKIEFELATTDPDGNPTNGIVRQATSISSFVGNGIERDDVKRVPNGSAAWDPTRYLNIWVCDLSFQGQDLLLGYAYPPSGAPNWSSLYYRSLQLQGVVVHYKAIGRDNPFSTYDEGKTAVHEVGHYLGLRHTWGDPPNASVRCSWLYDDGVLDTPLSSDANSGCNPNRNSCGFGEPGDLPDQIENYMDYAAESCQNMFSQGQADLMRSNLRLYRPDVIVKKDYPAPLYTETKLYPNPSHGELTITIAEVDESSVYSIRIVNMLGATVYEEGLESANYQEISYELGHSGSYYYELVKGEDEVISNGKLLYLNH